MSTPASRPSGRRETVAAPAVRPRSTSRALSWKGLGFGASCALIWGIQPIVSKVSVADGLTAADVTALRFLAAGIVLFPIAARASNFPVGRLGWARAAVLAMLAGPPFSLAIVGGVAFAPAFHSAVIGPGMTPIVAMLLGLIVLRARPAWGELGALALTLIGLVLFSFDGFAGASAREGAWRGDLLFALSGCMWAGFGFLANRWKASSMGAAAAISILSLMSVPLWASFMAMHLNEVSIWASLLQALFQGVVVGIVALYFYTRAVALLGAVQAALFVPLTPIVTALIDLVWLGEQASLTEVTGMAVVIAGMFLCIATPRG